MANGGRASVEPVYALSLTREAWEYRRTAYLSRIRPWIEDRLDRSGRGIKHPVYDFLFEYYSYRPSRLLSWSPGVGVLLEGARLSGMKWDKSFLEIPNGLLLNANTFPRNRIQHLDQTIDLLKRVASREPYHGCFGLHEWAK